MRYVAVRKYAAIAKGADAWDCGPVLGWALPAIEPIVLAHEQRRRGLPQNGVARFRKCARQVVNSAVATRGALNAQGACMPFVFIPRECLGDRVAVTRKFVRQHTCILQCEDGALRKKWQHRVSCIAQQRHSALTPASRHTKLVK